MVKIKLVDALLPIGIGLLDEGIERLVDKEIGPLKVVDIERIALGIGAGIANMKDVKYSDVMFYAIAPLMIKSLAKIVQRRAKPKVELVPAVAPVEVTPVEVSLAPAPAPTTVPTYPLRA